MKFNVFVYKYEEINVGRVMGIGDVVEMIFGGDGVGGFGKFGYMVVGFEVVLCSV